MSGEVVEHGNHPDVVGSYCDDDGSLRAKAPGY
jgi:hypothetical protein